MQWQVLAFHTLITMILGFFSSQVPATPTMSIALNSRYFSTSIKMVVGVSIEQFDAVTIRLIIIVLEVK